MSSIVNDQYNRPLRDLRLSLTDKCNFRCDYCMPAEVFGADYPFLKNKDKLNLHQIELLLSAMKNCGLQKLRLTGGEPLLRPDIGEIIRIARTLGIEDLALTTNGWHLAKKVPELKKAGLHRITVSLDAMDNEIFAQMNGVGQSGDRVREGIEAAIAGGFSIKVNMVVIRGVNDQEITKMANYCKEIGATLRFIEYMDGGSYQPWNRSKVVASREILKILENASSLIPMQATYKGEVAKRYRYKDSEVEVGFISSVTEPFCRDCNRARVSADGKLFLCLFAQQGHSLEPLFKKEITVPEVEAFIRSVWSGRKDRYSEIREELMNRQENSSKVEFSFVGG